jgi:hypothetical protein
VGCPFMGVRQITEATLCHEGSRSTCRRYILSTLKEEATYKEKEAVLMAKGLYEQWRDGPYTGRKKRGARWEKKQWARLIRETRKANLNIISRTKKSDIKNVGQWFDFLDLKDTTAGYRKRGKKKKDIRFRKKW